MTVKAVRIKNKLISVPEREREVSLIILIIAVFTASMIIGAGCVNFTDKSLTIRTAEYLLSLRNEQTIISIFFNSFIIKIILITVIFLSGLSCTGIPFICTILIIKGLSLGYIAGYLFSFSAKGIGYYLINIVPSNLIFVTSLVVAVMYGILMTKDIALCITDKKKMSDKSIRNYIIRIIIISAITVISSLIDAVFCKLYYYLFS